LGEYVGGVGHFELSPMDSRAAEIGQLRRTDIMDILAQNVP